MTGLLIKDWKLLKNQGRTFLFVYLMMCVVMFLTDSTPYFVVSYATFIFAIFTTSTISYDEYDNGMVFLMTLPVSRKDYVKEKYLFGFLSTAAAWLASVLACFLFLGVKGEHMNLKEFLMEQPVYLMLAFLMLAAALPMHLKYGPEKGRLVTVGALFAFGAVVLMLLKTGVGEHIAERLNRVSEGQSIAMLGIFIVFCLTCVLISYVISVKLVKNRQF